MNKMLKKLWYYCPNMIKWGPNYRKTLKLLTYSRKWSSSQMAKYQLEKAKEMIIYAYENTAYYKKAFDEAGFDPYTFESLTEMKKIPFLDKSVIRKYGKDLISKKYSRKKLKAYSTSGSTGEPATFYCSRWETPAAEQAFVADSWRITGYQQKEKMGIFRGEKFDACKENNIYWKSNISRNTVYSAYELAKDNVQYYADNLVKEDTKWIHAFPSVLYRFCNLLTENSDRTLPSVKGIFLSSETIHYFQIELIRRVFFNAKISVLYGHTEHACMAINRDDSLQYHFFPQYGYTELADYNEDYLQIVATGFNNHAMPLIRYRTGDLVRKDSVCQNQPDSPFLVVDTIEGRSQNYIVTKAGKQIVETAFIASVHTEAFEAVDTMQFEQFQPGMCILKIKPLKALTQGEIDSLVDVITKRLNDDVDLTIEIVDDIPLGANGKNKLIVQHIGA